MVHTAPGCQEGILSLTSRKIPHVLAPAALLVATLAGCGGSSGSSSSRSASQPASITAVATKAGGPTATVSTGQATGLGMVLVNGLGRALYVFLPDKHAKITCLSACAQLWPALKFTGNRRPHAYGLVKPSLLSSDPIRKVGTW